MFAAAVACQVSSLSTGMGLRSASPNFDVRLVSHPFTNEVNVRIFTNHIMPVLAWGYLMTENAAHRALSEVKGHLTLGQFGSF